MSTPVEVTTRYATSVDDLPAAWRFVMDRIDSVGDSPRITISPVTIISVGDMVDGLDGHDIPPGTRRFEVVVEGMVEEATR